MDRSTPEAVAEAYIESKYSCGEQGAGVRAQLVYPENKAQAHRDEVEKEEAPGGCTPEEVQETTTARVPSREPGIPAVVEVSNAECGTAEIPMIKVDGVWLVDETEVVFELACV